VAIVVSSLSLFASVARTGSDLHAGRLEIHKIKSRALGTTRTVRVWLPPHYRRSGVRYDVLYLNDGQNLFGDGDPDSDGDGWRADETAARLIAAGTIAPLVIVGIDNGGDRARGIDYLPVPDPFQEQPEPPGADRYLDFVIDEVMPFVARKYGVAAGPEHTGFGGSSYGAASAFYAALSRPGVFGRLLLESPSVGVGNGVLLERARTFTQWPERIDIGIGSEEGRGRRGPSDAIQTLLQILKNNGLDDTRVRFVMQEGGRHNEASWAARLPDALAFLFAPERNSTGNARR
jgi:predicted alpha/beta superfamily hydrolase